MALNIDIAPTLLALAGLEPSASMQGESLSCRLRAASLRSGGRSSSTSTSSSTHAFRRWRACGPTSWKYIRYVDEDPAVEELYDLRRDPQELENLAGRGEWAPVLEGLRRSWSDWRAKAR